MRTGRVHLFRWFGISIGFDLSWLIVAAVLTFALAEGEFPRVMSGISTRTAWAMAAVSAFGLFASVLLHELAHALVARQYGVATRRITLFIFGGIAELEDEPPTPAAEFVIAAAGPVASLMVALAAGVLAGAVIAIGGGVELSMAISWVCRMNLVLAIFNLLPAFPLDGGRMLRSVLWWWRKDLLSATRVSSVIGQGFAYGLIGIGVLRIVSTGSIAAGIWYVLIGFFVRNAARSSYQQTVWRQVLAGERVGSFMRPDPVVVPRHISISEMMSVYAQGQQSASFPVVDDQRLVGLVSAQSAYRLSRTEWDRQSVGTLTEPCSDANTVDPRTDALDALGRMRRSGLARLLVVDSGTLVGTLTLDDLLRGLARRTADEATPGG